jgi:uracil-DNA glycosylase
MTRFELHVHEWKDCRRCELWTGRKNVVIARGSIPADVVFVGEAPGDSEDVSGAPFVGPAGLLLDGIVRKALPEGTTSAFINLVGCFPFAAKRTADHKPPEEAIKACLPRVSDFIDLADPKLIVTVGKLATGWLDSQRRDSVKLVRPVPTFEIAHPAAILHANVSMQGLMVQRCVVTLANAVRDAIAGRLKIGPHVKVLQPKKVPPKPRVKMEPEGKPKTSTFVPGTIGPAPTRCFSCRRPCRTPDEDDPDQRPCCDREECQTKRIPF